MRKAANSVSFGASPPKAYLKQEYNRSYGFQKAIRIPSPVQGWLARHYMAEQASIQYAPERSMIVGAPHKFKGVRNGNVYGSRPARRAYKKGLR